MGPSPLSRENFVVPGIRQTPSAGEGSLLLRRALPEEPGVGGPGEGCPLTWGLLGPGWVCCHGQGPHPPEAGMVAVWTACGWSREDSGP